MNHCVTVLFKLCNINLKSDTTTKSSFVFFLQHFLKFLHLKKEEIFKFLKVRSLGNIYLTHIWPISLLRVSVCFFLVYLRIFSAYIVNKYFDKPLDISLSIVAFWWILEYKENFQDIVWRLVDKFRQGSTNTYLQLFTIR